MKERRKHPRYDLKTTVQAINVIDGRSLGVLTNISAGGFLLMCAGDFPQEGGVYQLRLLDSQKRSLDISVGAACIWRAKAHAEGNFWCGFKFIDVSPEARKELDAFLDRVSGG